MKITEIAKLHNVKPVTVYKWIYSGKLKAIIKKHGLSRRFIIDSESLAEFEQKYKISKINK